MRAGRVTLGVALVISGRARTTPPADSPAVPVFSTAPATATGERTVPDNCGDVAHSTTSPATSTTGQHRVHGAHRLLPRRPAGQPLARRGVWIGLASYVDEESARKRLTATVAGERAAGATASDVQVAPGRGVLVRNATWMLVAGRGRVTVVVRVVTVLVREDFAGALLGRVADHALTNG